MIRDPCRSRWEGWSSITVSVSLALRHLTVHGKTVGLSFEDLASSAAVLGSMP